MPALVFLNSNKGCDVEIKNTLFHAEYTQFILEINISSAKNSTYILISYMKYSTSL